MSLAKKILMAAMLLAVAALYAGCGESKDVTGDDSGNPKYKEESPK